jgi:hypothetical protein
MNKMRGAFLQSNPPLNSQLNAQPALVPQPAVSQPAPQLAPQPQPVVLSTNQRLDVLDEVLTQVEQSVIAAQPQEVTAQQQIQNRQQNMGMIAQAAPAAVNQVAQQQQDLQVAQASSGLTKESAAGAGIDTTAVEIGSMVQYVEQEPSPEISPEVSEYLQHVEDHANQQPQEVVVGEQQQQISFPTNYPKQAVVVLPITPEVEKQGAKKGTLESVRWLVEWSRKLIKMFSGTIIYREVNQ